MEGFEEKLNNILGDPQAMGQIMALARSLGGSETPQEAPSAERETEQVRKEETSCSIGDVFGELDPRFLQIGMKLLREYQRGDDQKTALLTALRPFVKEKRYSKLDKAIQVARLSRMIRVALEEFGKEEGENV